MHKYVVSKTTRIMMATVRHVTVWAGCTKFQTDGLFWTKCTRSKKTKFSAISKCSCPTACTMSVYWVRHAVHLGICFWNLGKMDAFRKAITISPICNKVFRTTFWNLTLLSPDRGTGWETNSPLKLFSGCRTLVGRGTMLLIPEIEGRFIYMGYQTWKSTGTVQRRMKSEFLTWVSLYAQST